MQVNLIMDTMGALALGTESPTPDLLDRKPYKRSADLVRIFRFNFCEFLMCAFLFYFVYNKKSRFFFSFLGGFVSVEFLLLFLFFVSVI